ncbi:MAG: glycosyltransferase family 2 protein [Candidatus Levybacteria bacterium]|nr:glycosyltransferase family 2 protein [Candidatus Levybacteria bacterium]
MLDLSIIIVNYNTKEFLEGCVDSLLNSISKKINYEIVVVDNASIDDSPSAISRLRQDFGGKVNIKTILNKENLGFSRANNQGIKISQNSRYILFLNPDTLVKNDTVEKMIEFMDKHKDAGAATCKVVMQNGQIDDASHRGFPTPWNAFCHFVGFEKIFPKSRLFSGYTLGWKEFSKVHEIDVLAGAFMLVRRKAGEDVSWWDEDYFFYGEDIEFCYQLKQKGWKIYYVPQASIMHFKGVSGGIKSVSKDITTANPETKRIATNARFNAMRIFYNKHYKKKYPQVVNWLVHLGISIKEHL